VEKQQHANHIDYRQLYSFMLNKQYDAVSVLNECIHTIEENRDAVDVMAMVEVLRTLMAYLISGHQICEEVILWDGAKDINDLRQEDAGQIFSRANPGSEDDDYPRATASCYIN